jgi:hypothetical protein
MVCFLVASFNSCGIFIHHNNTITTKVDKIETQTKDTVNTGYKTIDEILAPYIAQYGTPDEYTITDITNINSNKIINKDKTAEYTWIAIKNDKILVNYVHLRAYHENGLWYIDTYTISKENENWSYIDGKLFHSVFSKKNKS